MHQQQNPEVLKTIIVFITFKYSYTNRSLFNFHSRPAQTNYRPLTLASAVGRKRTDPALITRLSFFITSLQFNLCTVVTNKNVTQNSSIIAHSQYTTEVPGNIFLTGMHRLLLINKGRSPFADATHCVGFQSIHRRRLLDNKIHNTFSPTQQCNYSILPQ